MINAIRYSVNKIFAEVLGFCSIILYEMKACFFSILIIAMQV